MTGKKQAKKLEDKSKATQDEEVIELKSEELKSVVAEIMVQQHFSGQFLRQRYYLGTNKFIRDSLIE